VIALDLGVITFLTGFDTEGNGFRIGKYGMNALQRKLLRADTIQEQRDGTNREEKDSERKSKKNADLVLLQVQRDHASKSQAI
jgi:transposase